MEKCLILLGFFFHLDPVSGILGDWVMSSAENTKRSDRHVLWTHDYPVTLRLSEALLR
jgi:hypothetical protein